MQTEAEHIRGYRLRAHHLDRRLPLDGLFQAAGACGVQDTPPGAWETALWNRLEGCTRKHLHEALYRQKSLIAAWSYRGAPVVFPTGESNIFLSPLAAQAGEQPWIYTRGVTAALAYVQISFEEALERVKAAAACLDSRTIRSKEVLDQTLAAIAQDGLPEDKRARWNAPSMYGRPDRQTAGGAIVSFLLRPCAFSSLVVFGEREGASPTFTSFRNWVGRAPDKLPDAEKRLARKFLHCYGPTTVRSFMDWLGCSPQQAKRLWSGIADETEPVRVAGKTRYILSADRAALQSGLPCAERLLLLGAHDPYLDARDRETLLEDKALQRLVWKTMANPGVILKGGRAAGIWRVKAGKNGLEAALTVWEKLSPAETRGLRELAEEYAGFRGTALAAYALKDL